jgi:transcriptional regulator with XRE-family HTH domain
MLQEIFIANLRKFRKIRNLSQMTLSQMCDTTSNYIGQIEMGRRIPSFEKIEKIAAALGVGPYRLFEPENDETAVKTEEKAPETGEFLKTFPAGVKKEIISRLTRTLNKEIAASFDARNY